MSKFGRLPVLVVTTTVLLGCSGGQPDGGTTPESVHSLQQEAWNGGSQYYAKFEKAKDRGWTDPNFFPVSVFFESVLSKEDVDLDRNVGINTYLNLTEDSDLSIVRNSGMSVINTYRPNVRVGDETVGWLLADEPEKDGVEGLASRLQNTKDQIFRSGNLDGRFTYTNFTANMTIPTYSPGDSVASRWLRTSDVTSVDLYWYTRNSHCSGSIGGEVFEDGSGLPQRDGSGNNALSPGECFRASNYGYLIDRVGELGDSKSTSLFAFIENGQPFDADDPKITPDQMAGAVWNSLIHGARGINYFNHSFSGPCISSHNFRVGANATDACYGNIRDKAKIVNGQVSVMARVLNSPSFRFDYRSSLQTMTKVVDGYLYIFAMPSPNKGGASTGQQSLHLPRDVSGTTAEVMFESREVGLGGSTLVDNFNAEFSYHIYKIKI